MNPRSAPPIRVKAIDHVTIVASDLDRSARFYTEVLGMEAVERPAFGFPGRWFQAGTTQIHLNLEGDRAGKAGRLSARSASFAVPATGPVWEPQR